MYHISKQLAQLVVGTVFKNFGAGSLWPAPTKVYLGLGRLTGNALDPVTELGTEGVPGAGYNRVMLPTMSFVEEDLAGEPSWVAKNQSQVSLPLPTGQWQYDTVALYDTPDPGTGLVLFYDPLGDTQTRQSGEPVSFDANSVKAAITSFDPTRLSNFRITAYLAAKLIRHVFTNHGGIAITTNDFANLYVGLGARQVNAGVLTVVEPADTLPAGHNYVRMLCPTMTIGDRTYRGLTGVGVTNANPRNFQVPAAQWDFDTVFLSDDDNAGNDLFYYFYGSIQSVQAQQPVGFAGGAMHLGLVYSAPGVTILPPPPPDELGVNA